MMMCLSVRWKKNRYFSLDWRCFQEEINDTLDMEDVVNSCSNSAHRRNEIMVALLAHLESIEQQR